MPTKIDYVDEVWNPVTGCTKISMGCLNCYAEKMARRLHGMGLKKYLNGFKPTFHEDQGPIHIKRPKNFLVCSMGDIFHEDISTMEINWCFQTMAECRDRHMFLVLTKRPARILNYTAMYEEPPLWPNIFIGVSVENHNAAMWRIPQIKSFYSGLAQYQRWISCEPLLGRINIRHQLKYLDFVVAGAETGPGARPCDPDWLRSLRDQCKEAQVPFWLKQIDSKGSQELDGVLHKEMPECLKINPR